MYYEFEGSKGGVYYIEVGKSRVAGGVALPSGLCRVYQFNALDGEWFTGCSTCLPSDIDKAIEYSELLDKVINEVKLAMNKDKV